MKRLYVLGAGLPESFGAEDIQSFHARLISRDHEFSLETRSGVLPKFTHVVNPSNVLIVTYAFIEEAETVVPLTPQEVVVAIEKTGQIPKEEKLLKERMTILECVLLKEKALALVSKHYGRLRMETVLDAVVSIVKSMTNRIPDVVEYGRGPSPKDTWVQQGLGFLNHLVKKFPKDELRVLKVAHRKGTREHVTKDVTDLMRDAQFSEQLKILGLTKQNTVEVEIDWFQDPVSRLRLGMKFDYRRGIAFHTNVMDFESAGQRAQVLNKFAEEYQNAIGLSWTQLLYREVLPYYFNKTTIVS